MAVTLGADLLGRYRRFTLHNSPYVAHDAGRAVDLYPAAGAPSPVAGEVLDVRTVAAPPRPYADDHDHLVLLAVDRAASPVSWDGERPGGTGETDSAGSDDAGATEADATDANATDANATDANAVDDADAGADADPDDPLVARILHVDPGVSPGDEVCVGDPLGRPIRAGFFAPWVAPHLHVGFRTPDVDPYRASGSLPLAAGVDVEPLPWDGTGTVVERGDTYAVLDAPTHPAPGERFVAVAARVDDAGEGDGDAGDGDAEDAGVGTPVALDGGLPHYDGGGLLGGGVAGGDGAGSADAGGEAPVTLLGERVGVAEGARVSWDDVRVLVDGEPATGLSLFAARDGRFGAKVVCPDRPPALGETVTVSVENRTADAGRRA